MKYSFAVAAVISAVAVMPLAAGATDLFNQDTVGYTVTLTTADGTTTLDIAAESENMGVCDGCEISLPEGEKVAAAADDTVIITDGVLVHGGN
ncbi:hypothetical protein [Magnetovibrio sp.]|uniref:hypothetical protein n=1 Tax=Magnetovibrio sp. TaxID=2024836 RepID=UPI002F94A303